MYAGFSAMPLFHSPMQSCRGNMRTWADFANLDGTGVSPRRPLGLTPEAARSHPQKKKKRKRKREEGRRKKEEVSTFQLGCPPRFVPFGVNQPLATNH